MVAPLTAAGGDRDLIYHLHKLAIRLADASRPQDVIDRTIERAMGGFLARAAVITLVDGERLHLAGAAGCGAEYLRTAEGTQLGPTSPEAEAIISRRQKLYDPMDRRTRGRLVGEAADGGCFWAVLPLSTGRLPAGALSLAFATERTDIVAEEATLTALATTVAQGLERARTNETQHALAEALQPFCRGCCRSRQALSPPAGTHRPPVESSWAVTGTT